MAETPEDDFELLPFDEAEIIDADDELDAAVASALDDELDVDTKAPPPIPYGRTPFFDFERGRFSTAGGGSPVWVSGQQTLFQWIQLSLKVAKGACPLLPEEVGIEDPDDFIGQADPTEALADLEERLGECLLVHDRITEIDDYEADHSPAEGVIYMTNLTIITDEQQAVVVGNLDVEGNA